VRACVRVNCEVRERECVQYVVVLYRQRLPADRRHYMTTDHACEHRVQTTRRQLNDQLNSTQLRALPPVPHYRIAPKKSLSPVDNLPAKIRPARRPPGRDAILPVNCRPGETFLGGGDPIMGKLFFWAGDILIRGRHIDFVIISPRADFSWGRHFNVTPARDIDALSRHLAACACNSPYVRKKHSCNKHLQTFKNFIYFFLL